MTRRFLFTFVTFVFCVPCFAEELPSVPELIKRMYDYRMAIENMRAEVTVTYPVNTRQPVKETIKERYYFAYDKGRVRCDKTLSTPSSPQSRFYQYLSTPEFYFTRHTSPTTPHINDGNSLFVNRPLTKPFETYAPRRIGTDPRSFDLVSVNLFNYDTLLENFCSPKGGPYSASIDVVDGEKLYKISLLDKNDGNLFSYWINPQKGYNIVQYRAASEMYDADKSYTVTLGKFFALKGEIWFPKETIYRYKMGDNVLEERIVVDSVEFDVQDETPFTLAGLNIPVGYRIAYFDEEWHRTWDGEKPVGNHVFEFEPVSMKDRRMFWIVNGVGFALIAIFFLVKWIQSLRRRSN